MSQKQLCATTGARCLHKCPCAHHEIVAYEGRVATLEEHRKQWRRTAYWWHEVVERMREALLANRIQEAVKISDDAIAWPEHGPSDGHDVTARYLIGLLSTWHQGARMAQKDERAQAFADVLEVLSKIDQRSTP